MNPVNRAKGLLDSYDHLKDSDPDTAKVVLGQLKDMAEEVKTAISELRGLVDPATIETEDGSRVPTSVAAEMTNIGRRLDEAVSGHAKRTTRANAAKDKAVPPADS